MRRRTFIAALGSAAAWPVVAQAQHPEKVWRVGYAGKPRYDNRFPPRGRHRPDEHRRDYRQAWHTDIPG